MLSSKPRGINSPAVSIFTFHNCILLVFPFLILLCLFNYSHNISVDASVIPSSTLVLGTPSSNSPFYEHITDLFNSNAKRYVKLVEKNTEGAKRGFLRGELDLTALDVMLTEQQVYGSVRPSSKQSNPLTGTQNFCFPSHVGAIGIIYNLHPSLTETDHDTSSTNLMFSLETLIGVYNGTIRYWDDTLIQQLNPSHDLPHELIHVLHRSDESGTTWQLTSFFSHYSKEWAREFGNGTHVHWKHFTDFEEEQKFLGKSSNSQEQPYVISSQEEMIKYVSKKPYSIGYISLQSMFDVANMHDYLQKVQVAQVVRMHKKEDGGSTDEHHDDEKHPKFTSYAPNWHSIQKSFDNWQSAIADEEDGLSPSPAPDSPASRMLTDFFFGGSKHNSNDMKSLHKMTHIMEHSLRSPLLIGGDGYPLSSFSYLCAHIDFDSKRENIARTLYDFVEFSFKHASSVKEQYHIVALPHDFQEYILSSLGEKLTCQGKACFSDMHSVQFLIIGLSVLISLLVSIFICTICCLSCGGSRMKRFTGVRWFRKAMHRFVDTEMQPLLHTANTHTQPVAVYDHTLNPGQAKNGSAPNSLTSAGINGLELIELIGRGSFSEVFFGRYQHAPCAIKRFFSISQNDNVFQQCKQEVQMLQRIHHPNIVQYLASFDNPPNFYIVMDYHSRGDLAKLLLESNMHMSTQLKLKLALDAARGLYFLHSLSPPILHRDFKSSNLLVSTDWTLRIADLGLAKELNPLRKDQTMCGSAETASPEVFEHQPYSEKSDVYSFCMVLWQIFTRKRIYEGMNVVEVSRGVVYDNLRPSLNYDSIPEVIRELLMQGWQQNANKRPSMREILELLENLLQEEEDQDRSVDESDSEDDYQGWR